MSDKRPFAVLLDDEADDGRPSPSKLKKWSSSDDESVLTDGRMRVYVRVRPESEREQRGDARNVVEPIDQQMVIFDPIFDEEQYFYRGKVYKEPGRKQNKNIQFHFDRVFDADSTNVDVYEAVTKKFIVSFLEGYNCAVFAYGATGSGKTHTMLGTPEDPGVIFYTTMELFRLIEQKSEEEQLELSISYFEIYNEMVFDLLAPTMGKQLAVREDPKRGVVVANLSVHQPKDAQHLLEMLEFGNRNRTQHPTDANSESSRSHAVFQAFLKRRDFSSSQEMSIQLSKMSLIDLAGSERASVAYRENRIKSVQREGSNINKSLLALGNCINALAQRDPKKKAGHIPYRNSKLTLLLRDSLGGNCHTAMIAAVSPSSLSYDDTHNTLTYANRAKGIQLNLRKNNVALNLQPRNYNQALDTMSRKVTDLTDENNYLKSELNRLKSEISKEPQNPIIMNEKSADALNQCKNGLDILFKERLTLRKQWMEAESGLKKLDLMLLFRRIEKDRMERIGSAANEKENFGSLHSKKLHFIDLRNSADEALQENEQALAQMEKDLKSQVGDKDWFIAAYFRDNNLTAQFRDMVANEKHATDVARTLIKRLETNEELIIDMESMLTETHQVLSGTNRLSDEMDERFNALRRRIEGKKSVVWRDDQSESATTVSRHELENMFSLNCFRADPCSPNAKKSRKSRQLTSICVTPDSRTSMNTSISSGTTTKSKIAIIPPVCKDEDATGSDQMNGTFTVGVDSVSCAITRPDESSSVWKDVKSSPALIRLKENNWRHKSPVVSSPRSPITRPFETHRDNWSSERSDRSRTFRAGERNERSDDQWTTVRSQSHRHRNRHQGSGYKNKRFNF